MNSIPDQRELNAMIDGELEVARLVEIAALAQREPALRSELERLRDLRQQVRRRGEYHVAPAALRRQVARTLAAEVANQQTASAPPRRWFTWPSFASGLAAATVLMAVAQWTWLAPPGERGVEDEVVASHARAVVSQHLVDVASSEHHTLKPWLSGRLDFSPPVDAPAGTETLGARIDYIDGRPVAAIVMRRGGHLVDSFAWPVRAADSGVRVTAERGYQLAHWTRGGLRHWVISDLNPQEFGTLVQALRDGS